MNAYAWFEFATIFALVAWSAWILLGRLLPRVHNRLLRALGKAPQSAPGCNSGCSACSGCAASTPRARRSAETPVHFDPR